MFTFEQDNIIIERLESVRTLCFAGGSMLTLCGGAGLVLSIYTSMAKGQSQHQLLPFTLMFFIVMFLGLAAISQSGAYRLTLSPTTGGYKEETTRFGRRSARTGALSDFSSLKLTPLKNKDAGCVINLCRRGRPLFPIPVVTYYDGDYTQARADLHRLSAATGIPAKDADAAAV